jgi:hypothetical protein
MSLRIRFPVPGRVATPTAPRRVIKYVCAVVLAGVALVGTTAPSHAATPSAPHPEHWRLIYTDGQTFSPVSVIWTTSSPIARIQHGTKIDASVGLQGPPSSTVSSYGRCYQGFASSHVVKHLHAGHRRYTVTIAIGHGTEERRFTRTITLKRASLGGTGRQLHCH